MSDDPVTLAFIGRTLGSMQADMRRMRADMDTLMTLVLGQNDWSRSFEHRLAQFEQRLVDQTDVLVAEFKGRIGISQSLVDRRLDDLSERVEELETGKSRFTP